LRTFFFGGRIGHKAISLPIDQTTSWLQEKLYDRRNDDITPDEIEGLLIATRRLLFEEAPAIELRAALGFILQLP
jgi:hypothetical protein